MCLAVALLLCHGLSPSRCRADLYAAAQRIKGLRSAMARSWSTSSSVRLAYVDWAMRDRALEPSRSRSDCEVLERNRQGAPPFLLGVDSVDYHRKHRRRCVLVLGDARFS